MEQWQQMLKLETYRWINSKGNKKGKIVRCIVLEGSDLNISSKLIKIDLYQI